MAVTPPIAAEAAAQGAAAQNPVLSDRDVTELTSFELLPWLTSLRPAWDEWDDMWGKWMIKPPADNQNPFLSKVQVPMGMHFVESTLSKLLGENPSMNYEPFDDDSDDLVATILGKVVTQQMKRMNFEYIARDFIRQALVTGYSVMKVGWIRREETVSRPMTERHALVDGQPDLGMIDVQVAQRMIEVPLNQPFAEYVNLKDFVWPLQAISLDKAGAVWQRRWLFGRQGLEYLQQMEDEGFYQDVARVKPWDAGYWSESYQPQFDPQKLTPSNAHVPEQGIVELWERWEDDRITVIANRTWCLRDEPSPFWHKLKPFVDYTSIPRPSQLAGLGLMKSIDDQNEYLNTLMRQACDAATYTLVPAFKHTEGINWDEFVLTPGAHLEVPDTEGVEPLVQPNVDWAGFANMRQMLLEDMQRVTGTPDLFGGAFPFQGSRTATGMQVLIQEASARLNEMIKVLSYRTMRRFGWLMLKMNEQFLDTSVLVDFTDDPKAQDAWVQLQVQAEREAGPLSRIAQKIRGDTPPQAPQGLMKMSGVSGMLQGGGRLEPIPQVGQDKVANETQKRSDATQALQAIAPILASPQNPLNMSALVDKTLKDFGWSEEDRQKVMQTPPTQQIAQLTDAMPNGSASGPSGPGGGDNVSQGGVVGAPGAAGPAPGPMPR